MVRNKCAIQVTAWNIKLPVVLLPLIHCFDCIFVCYTIPIMHFWVSHISKKQWNLLCYPSWVYVLFFMFKARGSSMKRGSFNKKRSVKRKSTKVCVVIISDIKKIFWFVNGKGPFVVCLTIITFSLITATLPYDNVWTFDNHWCINQFRLLQWVTVLLRTILMSR